MKNSKIEWCHHTFNPWWGCWPVSPGCDNCYARRIATRFGGRNMWGSTGDRRFFGKAHWKEPLRWHADLVNRHPSARERVFCGSMCDVFDWEFGCRERLDQLHGLIASTPRLDWLLLTKRSKEAANYYNGRRVPRNVWLGVTAENQECADRRVSVLLQINAAVRFVSVEPMLGPIDLAYAAFNGADSFGSMEGIHWVICGGETGPRARRMESIWALSLLQQCRDADVPFFFKQLGDAAFPDEHRRCARLMPREFPR